MLYVISALAAVAFIGLDQWIKAWTVASFAAPLTAGGCTADAPIPFLPGVVELTRVHNTGAGWSSFAGQRWLLVGVSLVIVAVVIWALARRVVRHPLGVVAGMLIISGGLGTVIDRVRLGYVVDMFHFEFWPSYPVFNVADICIVVGGVLAAYYYIVLYDKYDVRKKTDGDAEAPTE